MEINSQKIDGCKRSKMMGTLWVDIVIGSVSFCTELIWASKKKLHEFYSKNDKKYQSAQPSISLNLVS